ncbi:DUF4097 family beta strand repeat-containing protein [uncultured Draconibacterium sp.]|uniref:DUF4097 family beta strand repeat-containing protein n=1 Tax=uncultured Draconibacterium sp. TaxID=1573823 RepID=UPI0032162A6C
MKTIAIFCAILLCTSTEVFSQKIIDEKIEVNNRETTMNFKFADDIVLEAWDKNYIELHVEVNIDDNKYNEYYALEIDKNGNDITLEEEIDFEKIKELKGSRNNCSFNTDLHYTLKIPKNLKVDLETISGEIELIGCEGQMSIHSISGFIDYSIPENHKANIDLSTITGDVYSNVKFDNKTKENISWVGTKQELSLNGGSTEVDLKTVSGDIYLRKY